MSGAAAVASVTAASAAAAMSSASVARAGMGSAGRPAPRMNPHGPRNSRVPKRAAAKPGVASTSRAATSSRSQPGRSRPHCPPRASQQAPPMERRAPTARSVRGAADVAAVAVEADAARKAPPWVVRQAVLRCDRPATQAITTKRPAHGRNRNSANLRPLRFATNPARHRTRRQPWNPGPRRRRHLLRRQPSGRQWCGRPQPVLGRPAAGIAASARNNSRAPCSARSSTVWKPAGPP